MLPTMTTEQIERIAQLRPYVEQAHNYEAGNGPRPDWYDDDFAALKRILRSNISKRMKAGEQVTGAEFVSGLEVVPAYSAAGDAFDRERMLRTQFLGEQDEEEGEQEEEFASEETELAEPALSNEGDLSTLARGSYGRMPETLSFSAKEREYLENAGYDVASLDRLNYSATDFNGGVNVVPRRTAPSVRKLTTQEIAQKQNSQFFDTYQSITGNTPDTAMLSAMAKMSEAMSGFGPNDGSRRKGRGGPWG